MRGGLVMATQTTLDDLIGIEHCKLGFYQDLQRKVEELKIPTRNWRRNGRKFRRSWMA